MNQALLLAMDRETTEIVLGVALVAIILFVVIPIGVWFQDRKGKAIHLVWQEVADRFQFRFTPEIHNERTIQGELEGSRFRMETAHLRDGPEGGFDITTYSIKPRNIDNILRAGRRDLDHYFVNKKLNSESIKEVLGRVKKTAGCTLRYVDGWVVWSEHYVPKDQELLIQRIEQMLDITELLLELDGPS